MKSRGSISDSQWWSAQQGLKLCNPNPRPRLPNASKQHYSFSCTRKSSGHGFFGPNYSQYSSDGAQGVVEADAVHWRRKIRNSHWQRSVRLGRFRCSESNPKLNGIWYVDSGTVTLRTEMRKRKFQVCSVLPVSLKCKP